MFSAVQLGSVYRAARRYVGIHRAALRRVVLFADARQLLVHHLHLLRPAAARSAELSDRYIYTNADHSDVHSHTGARVTDADDSTGEYANGDSDDASDHPDARPNGYTRHNGYARAHRYTGANDRVHRYTGANDRVHRYTGADDRAHRYIGARGTHDDARCGIDGGTDCGTTGADQRAATFTGCDNSTMKLPREQLSNNIAEILETLIVKGTGMFPGVKPNAAEIVERVNVLTRDQLRLREPIDFFDSRVAVKALDQVAREQTRKSQVVAVTAGVSTAFFGLPGLAVDLPVLVANTVGLVRRHAVTYGFSTIEDSTNDPTPLLLALGASVGADMVIDRMGVKVGEKLGLEFGTKLVEKYLVSRISEQFAARIITSWLPRLVPVIGTVTIAALDTAFLTLAGRESTRYFRKRHLDVRQFIAATDVERAQWPSIATGATSTFPGVEALPMPLSGRKPA